MGDMLAVAKAPEGAASHDRVDLIAADEGSNYRAAKRKKLKSNAQ
jgi:hypothetical protein